MEAKGKTYHGGNEPRHTDDEWDKIYHDRFEDPFYYDRYSERRSMTPSTSDGHVRTLSRKNTAGGCE